jgi:uncharacterized membrane protein
VTLQVQHGSACAAIDARNDEGLVKDRPTTVSSPFLDRHDAESTYPKRTMEPGTLTRPRQEVLAMMTGFWGWGWMGMSVMVLAWAAVFALAAWLVIAATRSERREYVPQEPARAVLDRRFAAGEISPEEYASMRRQLDHADTPSL